MSTPDAPVRPAAPSRRRFLRWLGATAVVLLTLAACGGVASRLATRPEPVGSPVSLSVADVYARAARALDRPGLLYHAMIRQEATPPTRDGS